MADDPTDIEDKPKSSEKDNNKAKKFLFDLHNFDEPDIDEEEDIDAPPPPSFYQKDIEKALQDGYQQGKLDGVVESDQKREKEIADLLEKITKEIPTLFQNEKERYQRFEAEAVILCRALFEALSPALADTFALNEIEALIKDTLETHESFPEIVIEVMPDYVDEINAYISENVANRFSQGRVSVEGNPSLSAGRCHLRWQNGGAFHDSHAIAEDIKEKVDAVLAADGRAALLAKESQDAAAARQQRNTPQAPAPQTAPPQQSVPEAGNNPQNAPQQDKAEKQKGQTAAEDVVQKKSGPVPESANPAAAEDQMVSSPGETASDQGTPTGTQQDVNIDAAPAPATPDDNITGTAPAASQPPEAPPEDDTASRPEQDQMNDNGETP